MTATLNVIKLQWGVMMTKKTILKDLFVKQEEYHDGCKREADEELG